MSLSEPQREPLRTFLIDKLKEAREKIGTVNPQYSYWDRLVEYAMTDDDLLVTLARRVELDGFEGV